MAIQISGVSVIDNSRNITNAVAVGATGPLALNVVPFFQNSETVASNFTIVGTLNTMSIGPITINTGVTVTVNTGGYWTVI